MARIMAPLPTLVRPAGRPGVAARSTREAPAGPLRVAELGASVELESGPMARSSAQLCVHAVLRLELQRDPLVEQGDVVLTGHQHPTLGVPLRVGGELAPHSRIEVLLVDPVEQLD